MRSTIRFDIYTVLILALVPTFLALAWGLSWNDERVTANQACKNTGHYLTEVGDMASVYKNAGTLQNANAWLTRLEAISPSQPARTLHDSVISSMSYAMTTNPNLDTTQPAALYDTLTVFQQALDNGRNTIVDKCPQFTHLISYAFPMYFREENP